MSQQTLTPEQRYSFPNVKNLVEADDLQGLAEILDENPYLIDQEWPVNRQWTLVPEFDRKGLTLLSFVAQHGSSQMLELVLRYSTPGHDLPTEQCIKLLRADIVDLLVKRGANPSELLIQAMKQAHKIDDEKNIADMPKLLALVQALMDAGADTEYNNGKDWEAWEMAQDVNGRFGQDCRQILGVKARDEY